MFIRPKILLEPAAMLLVAVAACGGESSGSGSDSDVSLSDLASNVSSDWDKTMTEGAKAEGTLMLYTPIGPDLIQPLLDKFTEETGVKVQLYSATAGAVRQRLEQEYKAKHYAADVVFGGDVLEQVILADEKILQPYKVPSSADYAGPLHAKDETWYSAYQESIVGVYNTDSVSTPPTSYDDLLSPEWKGQIGIEASDYPWYAMLLKQWGEDKGRDYFKQLEANKPMIVDGHTTLVTLAVSGEIPVAMTVYTGRANKLMKDGAPIKFLKLDPAVVIYNGVAIPNHAAHPYAALLFANWVLSKHGQELVASEMNYIPSHPAIASDLKDEFADIALPIDYDDLFANAAKWQSQWQDSVVNHGVAATG